MILEELRHLAHVADEDEAAHLRVEVLQRVDELQHEARHVAHRVGHVAQDDDLRAVLLPAVEKKRLQSRQASWKKSAAM